MYEIQTVCSLSCVTHCSGISAVDIVCTNVIKS